MNGEFRLAAEFFEMFCDIKRFHSVLRGCREGKNGRSGGWNAKKGK